MKENEFAIGFRYSKKLILIMRWRSTYLGLIDNNIKSFYVTFVSCKPEHTANRKHHKHDSELSSSTSFLLRLYLVMIPVQVSGEY